MMPNPEHQQAQTDQKVEHYIEQCSPVIRLTCGYIEHEGEPAAGAYIETPNPQAMAQLPADEMAKLIAAGLNALRELSEELGRVREDDTQERTIGRDLELLAQKMQGEPAGIRLNHSSFKQKVKPTEQNNGEGNSHGQGGG